MNISRLLLLSTAFALCSLATPKANAQLPICPTTYLCSAARIECTNRHGKTFVMGFAGPCDHPTTGNQCTLYAFTCTFANPAFSGQCITCP
jgi:hypothetical protein